MSAKKRTFIVTATHTNPRGKLEICFFVSIPPDVDTDPRDAAKSFIEDSDHIAMKKFSRQAKGIYELSIKPYRGKNAKQPFTVPADL